MKLEKVFWALTTAVIAALLIPSLIKDDMFLDGVTYAAISKNNGLGSFWQPHYTQTKDAAFYGHPPLVFGIQSLLFSVLGESLYVERFYTFLTAILTALGIALCWRLFFNGSELKKYSWLPVLLWITTPLVLWANKNNILENTLGVFTIFSAYFITKSLMNKSGLDMFLGSLLIVLAFLSKGPVGLFPLVAPFVFIVVYGFQNSNRTFITAFSVVVITVLLFTGLFIFIPESKANIVSYLSIQLLPAISSHGEATTNNRFSILLDLCIELLVAILLLAGFCFQQWKNTKKVSLQNQKTALYFLLIAIAAALLLIVSLKQRKYYLTPSIPFYIMAVSALIVPQVRSFMAMLSESAKSWLLRISYAALVGVFLFAVLRFGKFVNEKPLIADAYAISIVIPQGSVIAANTDVAQDWRLVAYLARIGYLSIDDKNTHEYFLKRKSDNSVLNSESNYTELDLGLNAYRLYKMK